MEIKFKVGTKIKKPIEEVFEAVVEPKTLCRYFTKTATMRLETGNTTDWSWYAFPETCELHVKNSVKNERIEISWNSICGYETHVVFEFKKLAESLTHLTIEETGWKSEQKDVDGAFDHCSGWSEMLAGLKVYLEYGIEHALTTR